MKKPAALFVSFILAISFLQIDCKKDTVSTPTENTPDMTSHNFTFTSYTFGGSGGSSYFKDVAIINDSDIWTVGGIFTSPDTSYNAAHWDGKKWELKKVSVTYKGNVITPNLEGIFALSKTNIWTTSGVPAHYDGNTWTQYHLFDMGILSSTDGSVNKIWGTGSSNIYFVGNKGTIVHFDGLTWKKQESGTTIDLRDVWGSTDGKTVWACGYSIDYSKSVLLKYDGISWQTVWSVTNGKQPYGDLLTSLWGEKNLYVLSNIGVYKQSISVSDSAKQILTINHGPYRIKGSAENNIVVVGDFAMIWHYNGANWKKLNETNSGQPLYSVAVSKNIIASVGGDYNTFPGNALIYLGRK